MRDILVFVLVFGSLPFILFRPYIGVYLWALLGYMNPHRLSWGFAYDFPFSQVVAIVTIVALLFTRMRKGIPMTALTTVWLLFIAWMALSTFLALVPNDASWEWDRTIKIQLISFVTMFLIYRKKNIEGFVWVIVLSLGFFGVKGGIFGVLTGGQYRVYGPPGSFIEDNNTIALALIMTIPLMHYLQQQAKGKWERLALIGMQMITAVAIVSTQSRGALVGGAAMILFLVIKSGRKLRLLVPLVVLLAGLYVFMPSSWHERMGTISNYEEDTSAMGRINAWYFAVNLANDRPLVGGGFGVFTPGLFQTYAPDPEDFHDSHSIYFEVLAEHGYVGLILFLSLGVLAFRQGSRLIRRTRRREDLRWVSELVAMIQVSMIGYAATGAFLGLAYFDLYYHMLALIVILGRFVREQERQAATADPGVPDPAAGTSMAVGSDGPAGTAGRL